MNTNMIGENGIILSILIIFFLLFSYMFLYSNSGGLSIREIVGLSSGGSIQKDYKRNHSNKLRRKFF